MKTMSRGVEENRKARVGVLKMLWPYIWPKDRPVFKLRILLAAICLVLAKVCNVYAPLFL